MTCAGTEVTGSSTKLRCRPPPAGGPAQGAANARSPPTSAAADAFGAMTRAQAARQEYAAKRRGWLPGRQTAAAQAPGGYCLRTPKAPATDPLLKLALNSPTAAPGWGTTSAVLASLS